MTDRSIRVLIVEDHTIVRKGISALLATEPAFCVAGEACNGREAIALARDLEPDVILMDLVMPEMDGVAAIKEILAANPEARILVLTSFATDDKVFAAIKGGALGYHLKDSAPEELVRALGQVARGESSLHPTITRKLLRRFSEGEDARPSGPVESLTPRETEVLQLVARGYSNREIAEELVITEVTVRTHVSNVLGKLQLQSRTQAALWALRHDVASLDDLDLP
jgi:NarL family two-component system response regulator LiaR